MLRAAHNAILIPGGPWVFVKLVVVAFTLASVVRLIPAPPRFRRGGQRRRGTLAKTCAVLACLVVIAGFAVAQLGHGATPQRARPLSVRPVSVRPASYLGVFEPGEMDSYQPVEQFGAAAGHQPDIALYYSGWNDPFQARFAAEAHAHGAMPFVQINPGDVPMAAVASGEYDPYLRTYAGAVRRYGHPVIISFAGEANGQWYRWGWTRTSPAMWVAAWRHVVTVFRQAGTRNVIWLWTVNRESPGMGPLRDYWPGAAYVTWAGLDGYYFQGSTTFAGSFAPTIDTIRSLTRDPILLSEVAIGPVAGQVAKIPDLFAGIEAYGLLGLVWFDQAQHGGVYHQDWRLEDDPPAVAVFRRAAAGYR